LKWIKESGCSSLAKIIEREIKQSRSLPIYRPNMLLKKLESVTVDSNNQNNKYSTDGRCGNNGRICPNGQCYSKNGYCGTKSEYCSSGCQHHYRHCSSLSSGGSSSSTYSKDGICSKNHGETICPSSKCCNKDGYCGTSSDHCNISKECQH